MNRRMPTLAAPEIALLPMIEVLLGPLWVWLGAGETPTAATLAGGALVITALLLNELAAFGVRLRARRSS
jgi:drug/metabolite transporter (DMT)-like permease